MSARGSRGSRGSRGWRRACAVAALVLLAAPAPGCAGPPGEPAAYAGTWAVRHGNHSALTLRLAADGSFTQAARLSADSALPPPARGRWRLERGRPPAVLLDGGYWVDEWAEPFALRRDTVVRLDVVARLGVVRLATPRLGPEYERIDR